MTDLEKEILRNAMRFCGYRERCTSEVYSKMEEWEIPYDTATKIIGMLKQEDFLNDERYAISLARGKFATNFWGREKIKRRLFEKGMNSSVVSIALAAIDEKEYQETLLQLIAIKERSTKAKNVFEYRKKIAVFLMRKGFEGDLVWDTLKEVIKD